MTIAPAAGALRSISATGAMLADTFFPLPWRRDGVSGDKLVALSQTGVLT